MILLAWHATVATAQTQVLQGGRFLDPASGEYKRELLALADAGFTPLDAIRAATVTSARLLGDPRLGRIGVDATADLVVVEGDPLQDLTVLQKP